MRRLGKMFFVMGATALGLALSVVAAWAIDDAVHTGEVHRNVTLDGVPIGGLGISDLDEVIDRLEARYAAKPVEIRAPGRTYRYSASELGLVVDRHATRQAALDAGRASSLPDRFTSWADGFESDRQADVVMTVDRATVRRTIDAETDAVFRYPTDPTFDGGNGKLAVSVGEHGAHLSAQSVEQALLDLGPSAIPPVTVSVDWSPLPGPISDLDLEVALAQFEQLTREPITVSIGGTAQRIGKETIRRWITSELDGDTIRPVIDPDRVFASLEALVAYETEGDPPVFTVVGGSHIDISLGKPALRCCDEQSVPAVIAAVRSQTARWTELVPRLVHTDAGLGEAQARGIQQVVGEFTTFHACCQNRVKNIQRIADIIRGALVAPGETFSINDYVGRRTRDKGFVAAGVIQNGHFTDGVGGGISQFATTMFNAAFFAGMDLDEYQSHSIYISRYPYGREATMSFPNPDLVWTNPTPYWVLVWTDYTSTSITVQLWSTDYFAVSQTGQSRGRIGACTRVNTFRDRVAPDGTVISDSVFATYRPGQGLDCNGNPTTRPN